MEHLLAKEGVAGSIPVSRFFVCLTFTSQHIFYRSTSLKVILNVRCVTSFPF